MENKRAETKWVTRGALFNETRNNRVFGCVSSYKLDDEVSHRAQSNAQRGRNFRVIDIIPGEDYKYRNRYSTYSYSRGTEFIETVWLIRYFPLKIVSSTPSFPSRLRNHIPLSREFHEIFWLN